MAESEATPFASRSVGLHVLRGIGAVALVVAAFRLAETEPTLGLVSLVGAVVLFGGCPTCWMLGLFETISRGRIRACECGGERPCRDAGG